MPQELHGPYQERPSRGSIQRAIESSKATTLLAGTLMTALLAVPTFAQVTSTDVKVPCRNYKDVLVLFDRLGYTPSRPYRVLRTITSGVTFSRVSRSVIFKGSWACYQQVQNAANAVLKLRPDGSRITSKRQLS